MQNTNETQAAPRRNPGEVAEPKLRPCPFCGGTSVSFDEPDSGRPCVDVVCEDCGARVDTPAHWDELELAAGVWNTRPDDAARKWLLALVGRLAQRVQMARLAVPDPVGEDALLREAAAVLREEVRT